MTSKVQEITGKRLPPNAGKGRPRGSRNKATASVKAALEASLTELGGVRWFVQLAKSNPDAYVKLLLQILPKAAPESVDSGDILDDPDPDV
ncbi:MAG: hypothetical protein GJU72_12810 [Acidithiobacillus ferriphilus]|jgi:hypothetical protein|uniref:hypothetical protein n=1 Tax=Acidithiobacillus ferriphilus TaxID=1689834 RepID=UPI00242BF771|nr:hypothetical protein [Acidithiobacillus ferriphilus]MBW9249915.1 hypothetical protein [Acidithiobacillus ferriphilus]MBW9253674.1 hypothetical protein [Acidithiobacillus ferriphilus]